MKPNRAARRAKQREWERQHPAQTFLLERTSLGMEPGQRLIISTPEPDSPGLYAELIHETASARAYARRTLSLDVLDTMAARMRSMEPLEIRNVKVTTAAGWSSEIWPVRFS